MQMRCERKEHACAQLVGQFFQHGAGGLSTAAHYQSEEMTAVRLYPACMLVSCTQKLLKTQACLIPVVKEELILGHAT